MPGFENLKFCLYDVPGVDGKNYKGDEIALMMYGLLPPEVDFKHLACTYNTIKGRRSTEEEEFNRRAHVVAFFVPQGAASDTDLMVSLAQLYYKITVEHKRKAIVIISHSDEIAGDEDKNEVLSDVCQKLSIDSANVFFLENYVDVKDKQFYVDKGILRILLAMISRADDFLTFDRLNPTECPFPKNPQSGRSEPKEVSSPKQEKGKAASQQQEKGKSPQQEKGKPKQEESVTKGMSKVAITKQIQKWKFLDNLAEPLRSKVAEVLKEEEIDDDETLLGMKQESWKSLGFKMGEIFKIEAAIKGV